jgi:hypothetical protein
LDIPKPERQMATSGGGNPKCYAQALGECRGPVDLEHIVSESVLELLAGITDKTPPSKRYIGVKGMSYLRGEEKPIGIKRLVGRVLCEHHNNELSRLGIDQAGRDLFVAMREMNNAAGDPKAAEEVLTVDGDQLERWMMKVLLGTLYSGNFNMPPPGMKDKVPPLHWMEYLFKSAKLPKDLGLYIAAGVDETPIVGDRWGLRLLPLNDNNGNIGGLTMWVLSFPFVLMMAPPGPQIVDELIYRPTGMRVVNGNKRIAFTWQGVHGDRDVVVEYRGPVNAG